MAAPKGNQFHKGHKGSGGRPGYATQVQGERMIADFFKIHNVETLKKKIASGKYSERDIALLKGLRGENTILAKLIDRILPAQTKVEMSGEISLTLAELTAKANEAKEAEERAAKRK
jgi:hypothetical protein